MEGWCEAKQLYYLDFVEKIRIALNLPLAFETKDALLAINELKTSK